MKHLPLSCICFHDCCKQFLNILGNSENNINLLFQCSGGLKSESRCWWGLPNSGGSGGILFCLLRLLGAPRVPGGPSTPVSYLGGHIACSPSLAQGHSSLDLGPTVNEIRMISRLLSKTLFPNKVTSQVPGICIDIFREGRLGTTTSPKSM